MLKNGMAIKKVSRVQVICHKKLCSLYINGVFVAYNMIYVKPIEGGDWVHLSHLLGYSSGSYPKVMPDTLRRP